MTNVKTTSINLVDLDADGIKNSLKNYLRSQEQFKDYDFEGSNLNVLIELLARNAYHYNFFMNMIMSETHIDSAQLRSSVLSESKTLNYLPGSFKSARASVKINFEASGESQPYIIPKGSQFSTLIKNQSYVFSTDEAITVSSANSSFEFTTDIYEGIYVKDLYVYQDATNIQRFKITNKNVDTTSITVTVFEDGEAVGTEYVQTRTLLDLKSTSKVYFLQSSELGYYEIYFGDNVIGKAPKLNSTIIIDYRVTSGIEGNGAKVFSVDFDPTGAGELTSTPEIETLEAAQNGQEQENIESIRYYAPRSYQVQERAVVPMDYEIILKQQFPEISAISVYGGEELDPPEMSKIYIAVDLDNINGLPDSKVTAYTNYITRRMPLSLKPVFIEPSFTYMQVNSWVRYNKNVTSSTKNRIKTLVTDAILAYNDVELNDFESTLRNSVFIRKIDDADSSIVSNDTDILIYKKLDVVTNQSQNISVDFGVALKNDIAKLDSIHKDSDMHIVESSPFRFNGIICHIHDDGDGTLYITTNEGAFHKVLMNVGSVDYDAGTAQIVNFSPGSYEGSSFKLYARPKDKDITVNKNTILTMEADEITVNVEEIAD